MATNTLTGPGEATPTDEIGITPEMIKAGEAAFYRIDRRVEGMDEGVIHIYRAMVEASKKSIVQNS